MPSAIDVLVNSLNTSKGMVTMFCQDLKPMEYLHRPTPAANCAAWLLGHLVLTDRKIMASVVGVKDLPPLPEGFETRFGRDEASARAEAFGDVSVLLPLFEQTRDALTAAVRAMDPSDLDKPLPFDHPRLKTVYGAINFMGLHVAMHCGQMSTIRRSLGRPPVV